MSIAALAGVTHREAGLASGLYNTTNQVGGAIGVAVASSVAISHFKHLVSTGDPVAQAQTAGYQWAFWVMCGLSIAGIVATFTLIRREELAAAGDTVTVQA